MIFLCRDLVFVCTLLIHFCIYQPSQASYTTLPFKQIGLKVVLGFCWVQGVINNLIRGNLSLADIMSASQYSLAPSEISFTTNSGPGLADGADPSLEMRIGF